MQRVNEVPNWQACIFCACMSSPWDNKRLRRPANDVARSQQGTHAVQPGQLRRGLPLGASGRMSDVLANRPNGRSDRWFCRSHQWKMVRLTLRIESCQQGFVSRSCPISIHIATPTGLTICVRHWRKSSNYRLASWTSRMEMAIGQRLRWQPRV
jgi:hypothetical protein